MQSFPESARIEVPLSLATDLLRVTEKLPLYENKAFYDLFLQETVYDTIRAGCLDGFDWLIREIRTRLKIAPFSVLINGLKFDGGNRLFGPIGTGADTHASCTYWICARKSVNVSDLI